MRGKRGKNLTNTDRNAILHRLLALVTPQSTLPRGAFTAIAVDFDVARSTVRHVWLRAAVNLEDKRRPCSDVSSRIKGHCGRNLKHANVAARMQAVPKSKRTTFRSIAAALNMPRSTLHDYYKRGIFVVRVKWAMDHLHVVDGSQVGFGNLMEYVHVDEKWFFGTSVKKTYYLAPGEEPPHRTCKSKHFINKVMFLSAVARPRWDPVKNEWFDGKIGTWHFTTKVPAVRGSRNRPAGTMQTTTVNVTRDVYKAMLIDNVIPAIKDKWPSGGTRCVIIQQDNARPHVPPTDHAIMAACTKDGWAMELRFQPPNSPDMNVLDLGFFRAIQSLQVTNHSRGIDDIVAATEKAWEEVDSVTLNSNFLTLQCCFQEVIRMEGNNNYKIPHMHKVKLAARGRLPEIVVADRDVINNGLALLSATDVDSKVDELAQETVLAMELSEFCSQLELLVVRSDPDVDDDVDDDDDPDDVEIDLDELFGTL
ncbi:hypothetical protein AaE_007744 [Aphanomyces astaci]|uniref:Tc1-like transposase DDE domain-containing protein n=1 Tax=Aphanomyces astaci TaxID=112090 RepID=A0A6A5A9T1_APHAT|nr:hypothetical protein AaE_007744 [Aphanomyces astaci]